MKKCFSVLLTFVLLFSAALPCFAANTCSCGEAPIVYVAALGSATLTLDKGTDHERILFRPQKEDVIKAFAPLVPAAGKLLADKNYDKFGDVLIACINKVFGPLALDNNGDSTKNVTAEEFRPENGEHGIDKSYYFGYDFRLDPLENAEKLHSYLAEVKAITGHSSFRLRASSMGGVVLLAYLSLYGSKDIETIIFQCCPLMGTAVAGELFNKKVELNKDALLRYGEQALPTLKNDPEEALLYAVIEMLNTAKVWDGLVNIADDLVLHLKDRVYAESLIPIAGSLPGIWSFVPDEYYESAKKIMLNADQSVLAEKLDRYHYSVQCNAKQLLKAAEADGTNVYIIAGYNMQRTPLVCAYKNNSDGTVDTAFASCGATVSLLGETLPEGYVQQAFSEQNYLSPDRVIDASTCALPESTWFVRDMLHCNIHDGFSPLYRQMFESKTQLTVGSLSEYPQFLQNDTVNQKLTPVGAPQSPLAENAARMQSSPSMLNFVRLLTVVLKLLCSMKV